MRWILGGVGAALWLAACSSGGSSSAPAVDKATPSPSTTASSAPGDAAVDERDAGPTDRADSGSDSGTSLPVDAGSDSGTDAGPDSGTPCDPVPKSTACGSNECGTAPNGCGGTYSCGQSNGTCPGTYAACGADVPGKCTTCYPNDGPNGLYDFHCQNDWPDRPYGWLCSYRNPDSTITYVTRSPLPEWCEPDPVLKPPNSPQVMCCVGSQ